MSKLPSIVAVVGPTASGKSAVALAIAAAFDGEIVNVDSRQLYADLVIGTAAPVFEVPKTDPPTVQGISHHLYGVVSPTEQVSVTEYSAMAFRVIDEILVRGKTPVLVGGTGLYLRAVIDNVEYPHVPPNEKLRTSLEQKSVEELATLLHEKNPEAYARIDIKNPRRVIRQLEIAEAGGGEWVRHPPNYDVIQIGISPDRKELYRRIDDRVDAMMARGLLDEVRALHEKYRDAPALDAIGYKELIEYLKGKTTLESAVLEIKHATRDYAKRQVTWFRRDARIHWITKVSPSEVVALIRDLRGLSSPSSQDPREIQ